MEAKQKLHYEDDHAELYGLLSEAEQTFSQAILATISIWTPLTDSGVIAGRTIFKTTLDSITHYKWEGNLPFIKQYPNFDTDTAILPPPILVALAYCLGTTQTICLQHFGLTSGQPMVDRTIISWPATLLKGLLNKTRFFSELSDIYNETQTNTPLLSNIQTRAVQLLVIGRHLINDQKTKIGQPLHPHIYLPQ